MNELIKYFEALEARLAAQEERIAKLESVVNKFLELQPQLEENMKACTELTERMHKILDEGIQVVPEPEVDVELVYPEDEEATVELPEETPAVDPVAEPGFVVEPQPVVEQPIEPEPASEPAPQPEPVAEQPVAPQPVVEQPQPETPRAPQQTSLFGTPVTDIRQAVSIGDRFLFQRELFGGNAEKLQKTLTELNALHSFDEAVAFIERFAWDKQSPTYELFINVLRRRFQ